MVHSTDLWVSLYLKVVVTQVTLHSKLEDGCCVIVANSGFLGIVAYAHSNVGSTATTPDIERELKPGGGGGQGKGRFKKKRERRRVRYLRGVE